jgi:hypothetical protein
MTWDPIRNPVDYILLNDKKSPGIAEVIGAGSPRKLKKLEGYAFSGGFVLFRGNQLAEFSVDLRLYTEQDWADWYAWKPLVDRVPVGEKAKALSIWHPHLEDLKIAGVLVSDVSQPKQTGDGEWTITIKFCEWRQPKRELGKPDAAKPVVLDPVEQKIEALTNQYNALAGPRPPPLPVRT